MTRRTGSVPADYFDRLYRDNPDPWQFASSEYERDKYAHTIAALGGRRFGNALEIGCSIGVLTQQMAQYCGQLLAIDVSDAALTQARQRCADQPHVQFENRQVPRNWPAGTHDLILLSEVLYYLDPKDIAETAALVMRSLAPGGLVVLVHWIGETDYPVSGDDAATLFMNAAKTLNLASSERRARYRLDCLHRI